MLGSQTIEVIIGLAFVYLLFSLVCSTLTEFVAQLLRLRAGTLQKAIDNMLKGKDPQKQPSQALKDFFNDPLVASLSRPSLYDKLLGSKPACWLGFVLCAIAGGLIWYFLPAFVIFGIIVWAFALILLTAAFFKYNLGGPSYISAHTFAQVFVARTESSPSSSSIYYSINLDQADANKLDSGETPPTLLDEIQRVTGTDGFWTVQKVVQQDPSLRSPLDLWTVSQSERSLFLVYKGINLSNKSEFLLVPWSDAPSIGQVAQDIRLQLSKRANVKASSLKDAGALKDASGADDTNSTELLYKEVEEWFNDVMERVSGWYTRKTRNIVLVFAIFVTLLLNIDTFAIAHELMQNTPLRVAIANQAEQFLSTNPAPAATVPLTETVDIGTENLSDIATAHSKLTALKQEIDALGVPVGWVVDETQVPVQLTPIIRLVATMIKCNTLGKDKCSEPPDYDEARAKAKLTQRLLPDTASDWGRKGAGLAVTIVLLALGAPFWYDLLGKLVNMRNAGKPPQDSQDTTAAQTANVNVTVSP